MIHLKKYKYNWQNETYELEKATEITTVQATAVRKYFDSLISPAYLFYKWELVDTSNTNQQSVYVAVADLLGYLDKQATATKELANQILSATPSTVVATKVDRVDKTQVEQNVVTIIRMLKSMCKTFGVDIKPILKKEL